MKVIKQSNDFVTETKRDLLSRFPRLDVVQRISLEFFLASTFMSEHCFLFLCHRPHFMLKHIHYCSPGFIFFFKWMKSFILFPPSPVRLTLPGTRSGKVGPSWLLPSSQSSVAEKVFYFFTSRAIFFSSDCSLQTRACQLKWFRCTNVRRYESLLWCAKNKNVSVPSASEAHGLQGDVIPGRVLPTCSLSPHLIQRQAWCCICPSCLMPFLLLNL